MGILAGVTSAIVFIVCMKYKKNEIDIQEVITNNGWMAPKRYSYSDVKKMTHWFKDQIGKGGYGTVYRGKLPDGLLVAVKVLSESKGNGEDFINEVASIGRTSHVNIVTLCGFCYERNKRALIYEFMPNGSLDNFIRKQGSEMANSRLEWKKLSEIAVGIARGLEYLHRGCNTRIVHFDIKPQNILLDKYFCPKVADFGLAKLCKTKESIGTVGYIAPEVFSWNFGGVSHKCDVYSYGMSVLEMVGARKNLDSAVSHTSEMFPHYVYKDLELDKDDNVFGATTEEEKEIARKMVLTSLWCIQTNPSDRPSMSKVVEMLEGPLHSLQIAPKPLLVSPTIAAEDSMTTSQPSETEDSDHIKAFAYGEHVPIFFSPGNSHLHDFRLKTIVGLIPHDFSSQPKIVILNGVELQAVISFKTQTQQNKSIPPQALQFSTLSMKLRTSQSHPISLEPHCSVGFEAALVALPGSATSSSSCIAAPAKPKEIPRDQISVARDLFVAITLPSLLTSNPFTCRVHAFGYFFGDEQEDSDSEISGDKQATGSMDNHILINRF
ncbi:receptor serine/threonine kinase, putative, partial [Prunus dulcis]